MRKNFRKQFCSFGYERQLYFYISSRNKISKDLRQKAKSKFQNLIVIHVSPFFSIKKRLLQQIKPQI